jgi:hypothetical protein
VYKTLKATVWIFILTVVIAGCSSLTGDIQIAIATDPAANLSRYKSYTWLGDVSALNDPENKWQAPKMNITDDIKFVIDRELRKKGIFSYTKDPDLAVVFFTGVDMENMAIKADPNTQQDVLKNIPAADLVVALIDVKTNYVVWMGQASAEVMQNRTDEMIRERIDYAITEMFKRFPEK